MSRVCKLLLILIILFTIHYSLFTIPAFALYDPGSQVNQAEYVPNQVIVKYKPKKSPDQLATQIFERQQKRESIFGSLQVFGSDLIAKVTRKSTPEENLKNLQDLKAKLQLIKEEKIFEEKDQNVLGATTQENGLSSYYLLKSPLLDVKQAIQEFKQSETIEMAEPNYIARIMLTPNDYFYDQLWGLHKIETPTAWDVTTGSESIIVAVIDSGVDYTHEDFDSNLIIKGPDYYNSDDDPMDDAGHGTHVAGTIGAIGNNSIGVVGVNWRVKIMALKVCNSSGSSCPDAAIAQAIKYATDNGARVINMSLGGAMYMPATAAAVSDADSRGVIMMASVGNCQPTCQVGYPARLPEVIAVAATDANDQRASFSSYGDTVDLTAPGVNIGSTLPPGAYLSSSCNDTDGNGYDSCSGTSMSCPHVAGLAALILANDPSLSADQVKNTLTSTVDDLGDPGKDRYYGHGRINAAQALGASGPTPTPTPTAGESTPTPTATPSGPTSTPSPTPTPGGPTATPTPTPPTGGPTATVFPSPTLTPAPDQITSIKIQVMLQSINSQKDSKDFVVEIKGEGREVVKTQNFLSDEKGIYSGTINFGEDNLESGTFDIFVKTASFLQKKFAGIALGAGDNTLSRVAEQDLLQAGDINNSGVVDQEDVDLLKEAYSPFHFTTNAADLNLDSLVNSLDYSLLVSNLGKSDDNGPTPTTQPTPGGPTPTPTFTPTPSPTPPAGGPTATPTSSPILTPSPTPTPTPECGDVNCDGGVNENDAILLLNYISYPDQYTICSEWAADVTCDEKINIGDFILLLNYIDHPDDYQLSCCD